jgi:hypothetical protein
MEVVRLLTRAAAATALAVPSTLASASSTPSPGGSPSTAGSSSDAWKAQNGRGETPYYLAAREGHVDVCTYLMEVAGADTTLGDYEGHAPADPASVAYEKLALHHAHAGSAQQRRSEGAYLGWVRPGMTCADTRKAGARGVGFSAVAALVHELREAVAQAAAAPSAYLAQVQRVIAAEGPAVVHAVDCHGTAAIHYAARLPDEAAVAALLAVAADTARATGTSDGLGPALDSFLALADPEVRPCTWRARSCVCVVLTGVGDGSARAIHPCMWRWRRPACGRRGGCWRRARPRRRATHVETRPCTVPPRAAMP